MIALSDLAHLRTLEGQEVGTSDWTMIDQDRIDAFAHATGDHQWIHVDPERAAASPLGGTIAHGFLTLSLLPLLRQQQWEGVRVDLRPKMGINYGLNRVRFISPVRVGKRIRLRTRLLGVDEAQPNVYQMTYQQTVEIEGEERPAMVAESIGRSYL